MMNLRRTTATVGAAALLATPLAMLAAGPAQAADREFRYAGAKVEFDVDKDNGRFEVEADIDYAKPGSTWRIILRHDGKVIHNRVHRADRGGDVDVERHRLNTRGKDTFKLTVKKVGVKRVAVRTIRRR